MLFVLQGRQAIYWATLHSAVWHFGLFKMNFHNDPVTSSYCHETCIGRMVDILSADQGTTLLAAGWDGDADGGGGGPQY